MNRITKHYLQTMVAALLVSCCHQLCAQELGVWYDTELQTDFKGHGNYANLLYHFLGSAQHTGTHDGASSQTALWAYTEQSLTDRLSLIVDYSHAFGPSSQCTDFFGFGGQYSWSRSTLGLFSDYARFRNDSEWATELTYKYNLTSLLFLQASCQFVHHGAWQPVGLIRMSVRV